MSTPPTERMTGLTILLTVSALAIIFLAVIAAPPSHPQSSTPNNFQPIKGAFGYNLGDTLSATNDIETNDDIYGITCKFPPPVNLGLADDVTTSCELVLTEDRRIAEIQIMSQETVRFNLMNIKKVLEDKYGSAEPGSEQKETDKSFRIGQENIYIRLNSSDYGGGPILSVSYVDLDLTMVVYDEQKERKARLKQQQIQHQEQIQKQMQEDLKDKL